MNIIDFDRSEYNENYYFDESLVIDSIFEKECEFLDSEKKHNQYYIGIYTNIKNEFIYANSLTKRTFFEFPYLHCLHYLYEYSIILLDNHSTKIHIMQLDITKDGTYCVVIKTIWLKLIQRCWKRVFKERKNIIEKRCSLESRKYVSIHGKYPQGLNRLPSLFGLMKGH
jgi:hypothetical protein